jgi:hypothetical protein
VGYLKLRGSVAVTAGLRAARAARMWDYSFIVHRALR